MAPCKVRTACIEREEIRVRTLFHTLFSLPNENIKECRKMAYLKCHLKYLPETSTMCFHLGKSCNISEYSQPKPQRAFWLNQTIIKLKVLLYFQAATQEFRLLVGTQTSTTKTSWSILRARPLFSQHPRSILSQISNLTGITFTYNQAYHSIFLIVPVYNQWDF